MVVQPKVVDNVGSFLLSQSSQVHENIRGTVWHMNVTSGDPHGISADGDAPKGYSNGIYAQRRPLCRRRSVIVSRYIFQRPTFNLHVSMYCEFFQPLLFLAVPIPLHVHPRLLTLIRSYLSGPSSLTYALCIGRRQAPYLFHPVFICHTWH